MSARDVVVDAVEALLPDGYADVLKYAKEIDPPRKPKVMVRVDEVLRTPSAPAATRTYRLALILIVPRQEPGVADDDLEDLLELVLWSLDRDESNVTWTSAKRAVYRQSDGNEYPAFEVSLELPITVTDPTQE